VIVRVVVGATVVVGAVDDEVVESATEVAVDGAPVVESDEQLLPKNNRAAAPATATPLRHDRRVVARSIRPPRVPFDARYPDAVPEKITILLPVDAEPPPERPLAAGVESLRGASIGFVDNGLWRSMVTVVDALAAHAGAQGATMAGVTPFDHLCADFPGQRRALLPFAQTVDVVVVGLGN
jgi:hypothetical protein